MIDEINSKSSPSMEWIFGVMSKIDEGNPAAFEKNLKKAGVYDDLYTLWKTWWSGEKNLEYEWSKEIISKKNSIENFTDYSTYCSLIDFEIGCLNKYVNGNNNKFLFVGSGPFPITPIIYQDKMKQFEIECADYDKEALAQGDKLLEYFNKKIVSHNCHIGAQQDLKRIELWKYDLILTAGMVGMTNADKNSYLYACHPFLNKKAIYAVRSFCIPFVPDERTQSYYQVVGEYKGKNGVASNLTIMRKK